MKKHDGEYAKLDHLVDLEDYQGAADLCRVALARGQDRQFWETQLGYISFLNERDDEAYYDQAPSIFQSLAIQYPDDANAHFWLGYISDIILHDVEKARQELRCALVLNPDHPYANLVLAGLVDLNESAELLRRTLKAQLANFRALRQLAEVLNATYQREEVLNLLERMLTRKAYVERNYGIMNNYMNYVLTGANHEQSWRAEAQAKQKQLKRAA